MVTFIEPNIALSDFIEGYLTISPDQSFDSEQNYYTAVPDPFNSMMFNYRDPVTIIIQGENPEIQEVKGSFAAGFYTKTVKFYSKQMMDIIVVVFKPSGIKNFFNLDIGKMTNKSIPLLDIAGKEIIEVEDQLRVSKNIENRIAIIENYFFNNLKNIKVDILAIQIANLIIQKEGNISVIELAEKFGYNKRYLAVKFKNAIGISPKLFARIVRFKNLINYINIGDINWVQSALHSGYYDQAHFIKDFKEFSGMTPEKYILNLPNFKYEQALNELISKYVK